MVTALPQDWETQVQISSTLPDSEQDLTPGLPFPHEDLNHWAMESFLILMAQFIFKDFILSGITSTGETHSRIHSSSPLVRVLFWETCVHIPALNQAERGGYELGLPLPRAVLWPLGTKRHITSSWLTLKWVKYALIMPVRSGPVGGGMPTL